jgi:hypothetical protein
MKKYTLQVILFDGKIVTEHFDQLFDAEQAGDAYLNAQDLNFVNQEFIKYKIYYDGLELLWKTN